LSAYRRKPQQTHSINDTTGTSHRRGPGGLQKCECLLFTKEEDTRQRRTRRMIGCIGFADKGIDQHASWSIYQA
jgi:hypothetical protein